jgi:hypothetical protein
MSSVSRNVRRVQRPCLARVSALPLTPSPCDPSDHFHTLLSHLDVALIRNRLLHPSPHTDRCLPM